MRFQSYRAIAYLDSMGPEGARAAEAVLDRWAGPGWRETVGILERSAKRQQRSAQQARQVAIALVCSRQDVLRASGAPDGADEYHGRESVSGWWTRFKRKAKRSASAAWDAFSDTVKDAFRDLGDWDSFGDVLDNMKAIATGGATVTVDATQRAAEEAINEAIGHLYRELGDVLARYYRQSKSAATEAAHDFVERKTNEFLADVAKEIVGIVVDLLWGYPQCVCEYACIKPVSDGLRDSGGIPAIIGAILSGIYPAVQLQSRPYDSMALRFYAEGLPLLPNAKISKSNVAGKIVNWVSDELDESISTPKAFEWYSPWLVDYVARGYEGPTTLTGGDTRNARWYFEHPNEALDVLEQADKIAKSVSFLYKWLGKIDRYVDILLEARRYGKMGLDAVRAIDTANVRQTLSAAARNVLNEDTLERLGGWALERGRGIAKRQLQREVRQTLNELGITEFLEQVDATYQRANVWVTQAALTSGAISGAGSDYLEQWMPAAIGLQARAKFSAMVELWAAMTPAERAKWQAPPEDSWATKATDYPAWFELFSKNQAVQNYAFQLAAPIKYKESAQRADDLWSRTHEAARMQLRLGGKPTVLFGIFKGRIRIPKVPTTPPSVRDVGWPLGFPRPPGIDATPGQYLAWREDWLDIHDTKRFRKALEYYEKLWLAMSPLQRRQCLQSTPRPPRSPALAVEPSLVRKASADAPKLRVTGGPEITRERYWALQMIRVYPDSLETKNPEKVGKLADALQTAWSAQIQHADRMQRYTDEQLGVFVRGIKQLQRVERFVPSAKPERFVDTPWLGQDRLEPERPTVEKIEKPDSKNRFPTVPVVLGALGAAFVGVGILGNNRKDK